MVTPPVQVLQSRHWLLSAPVPAQHDACPAVQRAQDSGAKIDKIGQMLTLNPVDYHELDQLVHQFKGSSASLGAHTIAQLCIQFRERCQQQDLAACAMLQQQLKVAYADLQTKLGEYMRLETHRKQCLAAGMN